MSPHRPERFAFVGAYRGPCALLVWEKDSTHSFQVVLAEWPESLFSMLRAGVLAPEAEAEARALLEMSHRVKTPGRSP